MSEASGASKPLRPQTLTQQQWLDHFKRCESSGLTVATYVRNQGLKLATFYRWRRELLSEPVDRTAPEKPSPSVEAKALPESGPTFHKVTVKPAESPPASSTETLLLRFRLPNGINCELAGISSDSCTAMLESLTRLRL